VRIRDECNPHVSTSVLKPGGDTVDGYQQDLLQPSSLAFIN
jgi:hypothetical protein